MSFQGENSTAAASSGESSCSSEDEGDIQCEILEKQRDEASQMLSEMEEVSSQLLKEMDVLEMQFQIERSCRESAEALAVKVTKENKVLKRRSQALLPLLPKLPENMATMTFDLESDQGVNPNPDGDSGEEAVLQGQAQIRELQASVEQLLREKMQLCEQVDSLKREQSQLEEQLAQEIGEKEAILKKLSKQNKNMNKMKRVSQLVTEEFTEISQKLDLEQGLRQHAEVFAHQGPSAHINDSHPGSIITHRSTKAAALAEQGELLLQGLRASDVTDVACHRKTKSSSGLNQGPEGSPRLTDGQVLVKQKETQRQSMVLQQSSETSLQLQHALEQVAHISSTLQEIQRYYRNQVELTECALEESSVLSELQCVRGQLESSEEERRTMDTQLREAQKTVTQLQGEVKQLEDRLKDAEKDLVSEKDNLTPALPPPPPPPLPPLSSSTAVDPLVVLRNKRKESANNIDKKDSDHDGHELQLFVSLVQRKPIHCVVSLSPTEPDPTLDMKTRAVDAMMERIKKGIVLRPTQRPQVGSEDDCAWRDQRIEKRKSAVLQLKGMLDTIKHQGHRRAWSRNRFSRNVGEAELQMVLQRRRRAMADGQDTPISAPSTAITPTKIQGPQPGSPAAGVLPWAGESGSTPVLRRLQQNREKRNSHIRESKLIICQENI
ncbi:shootin-1-like [Oncorhynchus masou masou]|uniref:shootin-1-like n=1 Tax=Oncorhynchus masou masou TaxID=90313 RepID=UPI003183937D